MALFGVFKAFYSLSSRWFRLQQRNVRAQQRRKVGVKPSARSRVDPELRGLPLSVALGQLHETCSLAN